MTDALVGIANEVNGDYYIVGQQGEIEEDLSYRWVHLDTNMAALFNGRDLGNVVDERVEELIQSAINLNYWMLRRLPTETNVPPLVHSRVAYLRVLGLVKGLINPNDTAAAHNVSYSDIKVEAPGTYVITTGIDADGKPIEEDAGDVEIPDWNNDRIWRKGVLVKLTNIVCSIAYMMRVRGHHWTEDSQDKYVNLWRRSMYQEDDPGIEWKYLAHHAFHYVFPDILDTFWKASVDTARCSGTLAKRYQSYAAGTAAIGAVQTGANDVLIVFPQMKEVMADQFAELDRCVNALKGSANRWVGSINRRFYNGGELTVDERVLSSLASVVLSALEVSASSSPLRNSLALRRVASNAPITGSIMVTIMQKATQDARMVNALLGKSEDVD
jgi:hypothetical protein